jgi:hypothetical protein
MSDHCENCGRENPATEDGYTACCNELVCDGRYTSRFGTRANNVTACCWARAEIAFGGRRNVPDGSSRLS